MRQEHDATETRAYPEFRVQGRHIMTGIPVPLAFMRLLNEPSRIAEIAVVALGMYVFVHLILRVTGSRTLAQITTFDIVVVVAIGAVFGETVMNQDIALFEGFLAIIVLVGLQWASDWITMKRPRLLPLLTPPPHLVFYDGRFLEKAMKETRITKDEIHDAMRQEGCANEDEVLAVILERNGEVTVVPHKGRDAHPRDEGSTFDEPAKDLDEEGR